MPESWYQYKRYCERRKNAAGLASPKHRQFWENFLGRFRSPAGKMPLFRRLPEMGKWRFGETGRAKNFAEAAGVRRWTAASGGNHSIDTRKRYIWSRDRKGGYMEYREKIWELTGMINNERVLKFIYELLISFQKKWGV